MRELGNALIVQKRCVCNLMFRSQLSPILTNVWTTKKVTFILIISTSTNFSKKKCKAEFTVVELLSLETSNEWVNKTNLTLKLQS